MPADVKLKDPKDFILIGKPATRTDAPAKSNGTAIFTQDVKLPGMLTAVVLHPPRFGAKLKSFDAAAAKQVKGVEQVVPFSTPATNGVAVLAKDYWSAKKGRDALTVGLGRVRSVSPRNSRDHGGVQAACDDAGIERAQGRRRRRGAERRGEDRSKPPTNSRTSRTPAWSP